MFVESIKSLKEVRYVLDNLSADTVKELVLLLGKDYKRQVFQVIRAIRSEKYIIKLRNTKEPVGVFGLIPHNNYAKGIFLLTCENLKKGNTFTYLKSAKRQINKWCKRYGLILDSCCKTNQIVKKWLTLLGFKPSAYQDDDFQIWYKGNIEYYEKV